MPLQPVISKGFLVWHCNHVKTGYLICLFNLSLQKCFLLAFNAGYVFIAHYNFSIQRLQLTLGETTVSPMRSPTLLRSFLNLLAFQTLKQCTPRHSFYFWSQQEKLHNRRNTTQKLMSVCISIQKIKNYQQHLQLLLLYVMDSHNSTPKNISECFLVVTQVRKWRKPEPSEVL